MKNKKHLAFLGAIILFVIVLASGVYIQEDLRRNGQQVILATVPVDPRDILRGDYVDLAYEIGRGNKAEAFAKALPTSTRVYTVLTLGEDNRVLDYSFATTEPEGGIYIRGRAIVEEWETFTEKTSKSEPVPVIEKR